MNPRVKEVVALAGHRLRLTFINGETGIYDCTPLLGFGVFRELADVRYFRKAAVAYGTVVWPNSQDICPDTLYLDSVRETAVGRKGRQTAGIQVGSLAAVCEKAATYGRGIDQKAVRGRIKGSRSTGRKPS
jgi:hypothetical protein